MKTIIKQHELGERPWGSYQVLDEGPGWKVKRIEVEPGQKLSLQYHHHRAEKWTVLAGFGRFVVDSEVVDGGEGTEIIVPVESRHRMENIGTDLLVVLELQTGDSVDESDIVRVEDKYGRTDAG